MILKAINNSGPSKPKPKRRWRRRPQLRKVPMLPTLLTLGNLLFGFAAIYLCGREMQDFGAGRGAALALTMGRESLEAIAPTFLSIATWLLVAAMICDALDGRVARKRGQSTKFGEQLDSLADVVSFGVAPALIMITLIQRELAEWDFVPFGFDQFGKAAVLAGVIYVSCAALRLARFTVEASAEEAAHEGFLGMPSPGAAAAVTSLVLLHEHLEVGGTWQVTADIITRVAPICTLAIGLLMVSRVPYKHAVSSFLRRRPFWHLIPVLLATALLRLYPEQFLAILSWTFVGSGLVRWVSRKITGTPTQPQAEVNGSDESTVNDKRKQAQ